MKVNNKISNNRWKEIPCKCNHESVETEYPIAECLHCKFQECEDSIPSENFKIDEFDDKGDKTGTKTIKEITLVHGEIYEDVIGWSY